jgi:hypothetical protein
MPKIIANKPQQLEDLQFKLEIGSMSITDELRVRAGTLVSDLTANGLVGPFKSFIFPEMATGTFNMDLSEAPSQVTELDILVDAQVTSFRSWSLTGLSTGEFWQNDGVEVASGASCLMLSFSKSSDGRWSVTAKNKFEGEEAYGAENSNLPDLLRPLAAQAQARGLGKNAAHFSTLIDTTESMKEHLEHAVMQNLITVIRGISASKNLRPVFTSVGGSKSDAIGVLDAADRKYLDLLDQARSDQDRHFTPPFSETLEKTVKSCEPNSALYVITDSMPWIDVEEMSEDLANKDSYVFVVLLSEGLAIDLTSLPARIMVINVANGRDEDSKELMKRFL